MKELNKKEISMINGGSGYELLPGTTIPRSIPIMPTIPGGALPIPNFPRNIPGIPDINRPKSGFGWGGASGR